MALSPRNRRAMAVLAGVAVAAAAGAVFFFFVMGGGAEPPQQSAAPVTQTPTTAPKEPGKAKANKPAKKRPARFAFFGGRDPFVPLVVAGTGGAAGTSGAISAVDSPSGGASVQDATVVGGRNVSLIDISGDRVQVSVDGRTHTVRPGDEFAGNFELVSVSGGCANFLYGDQSFTLCEASGRK